MRRTLLAVAALLAVSLSLAAQPGGSSPPRDSAPPDAWKDLPPATAMVIGGDFMCTLDAEGAAWCWGANHAGQLGTRTREWCGIIGESGYRGCYPLARGTAARVDGPVRFASLAAGDYHACGIAPDGRAYCWGSDRVGQVGAATSARCLNKLPCSFAPVEVEGGRRWRTLYAFEEQTCGLTTDGALFCWGRDLGDVPTAMHPEMRFTAFAMGKWWCGTSAEGGTYCWGEEGQNGRLGTGDEKPRATPARVAGGHSFASLTMSDAHTCGLTAEGQAYCWGLNAVNGPGVMLGTRDSLEACGFYSCARSPHPVQTDVRFRLIDAAYDRTCGLDGEGRAWCWGQDQHRQIGLGAAPAPDACGWPQAPYPCARVPVPVAGDLRFTTLSARQFHTCGLTADGAMYCWGRVTRGVPARVPPTGHP